MQIDYYYTLMSPWAYLGSKRFHDSKEKYHFKTIHHPLDIIKLFSESEGEPLQREPAKEKNII